MTGVDPRPLSRRPPEPIDRIWYLAFPAFYVIMAGYGVFAALYPIQSVDATAGPEEATLFGAALGVTSVVLVAASARSVFRQAPDLEAVATVAYLLLMVAYLAALYAAVLEGAPGARPGSAFLPLLFSVFPFFRLLAIARSGRLPWRRRHR